MAHPQGHRLLAELEHCGVRPWEQHGAQSDRLGAAVLDPHAAEPRIRHVLKLCGIMHWTEPAGVHCLNPPTCLVTLIHSGAGGIVLYALGVAYMVLGLVIINNHYFMPSLRRLSHRLRLSDNVAGAIGWAQF